VVYVGSDNSDVYALNATTGTKLWQFLSFSGASSPAVANGVVYVGGSGDALYALNAATGAELRRFTTGASVTSSHAVANGVVYIGSTDGNVYAFSPIMAKQGTKSKRPYLKMLRPDPRLKVSIGMATAAPQ
jgi:outer membrane protein assembly factor BamB